MAEDKTNLHKVNERVAASTIDVNSQMIPFLRDHDHSPERAKAENMGKSPFKVGNPERVRVKNFKRENSWHNYSKPISDYNVQVHPSMKLGFEAIATGKLE